MSIQGVKAVPVALAMAIAPITIPAQNNKPQNDNLPAIVVLDKDSLQKDVFEKSVDDSTTITFVDAQQPVKEKVNKAKNKVKIAAEKVEDIQEVVQDTTRNGEIKEEIKESIEKKNATVAKILFNPNISKEIGLATGYGTNVPGVPVGVNAKIYTDKVELVGDFMVSKDDETKAIAYGVAGKYFLDMSKGFFVYPKASVQFVKLSKKDEPLGEQYIAPTLNIGTKYVKDFDCGIRLVPAAEVGASLMYKQSEGSTDYEKKYYCDKLDLDFLLMLSMYYKNLVLFVKGGESSSLGYNVGGGVNFKF